MSLNTKGLMKGRKLRGRVVDCRHCGRPIMTGELIWKGSAGPYYHLECWNTRLKDRKARMIEKGTYPIPSEGEK